MFDSAGVLKILQLGHPRLETAGELQEIFKTVGIGKGLQSLLSGNMGRVYCLITC